MQKVSRNFSKPTFSCVLRSSIVLFCSLLRWSSLWMCFSSSPVCSSILCPFSRPNRSNCCCRFTTSLSSLEEQIRKCSARSSAACGNKRSSKYLPEENGLGNNGQCMQLLREINKFLNTGYSANLFTHSFGSQSHEDHGLRGP